MAIDFEQLRQDMEDPSPLTDALWQKAAGERNDAGDLWGDWICAKAAMEMEQTRRIALAAEKYRKARLVFLKDCKEGDNEITDAGQAYIRARVELFALLTGD